MKPSQYLLISIIYTSLECTLRIIPLLDSAAAGLSDDRNLLHDYNTSYDINHRAAQYQTLSPAVDRFLISLEDGL